MRLSVLMTAAEYYTISKYQQLVTCLRNLFHFTLITRQKGPLKRRIFSTPPADYTILTFSIKVKLNSLIETRLVTWWDFRFSWRRVWRWLVFWDIAPCCLVGVYWRFRDLCCILHQGDVSEYFGFPQSAIIREIIFPNINVPWVYHRVHQPTRFHNLWVH